MTQEDADYPAAVTATEQTPLLATKDIAPTIDPLVASATTLNGSGSNVPAANNRGNDNDDGDDDDDDDDRPFPKWQILWLCFARIMEPMAFFSIFPYINQMVQENGQLDDTDVGFYSGLIESLFSLTQAMFMLFWGKAADKYGRKPVLIFSLVGVSVATSVFGLAKTIWQMILLRCIAGIFGGTIVTIRTMLAELSTPRTQALVFSWLSFSSNLGIFLGPLLGGVLADPAHQYPQLFGNVQFFLDYPYALASLIVSAIGFIGIVSTSLFLKETLVKTPTSEDGVVTHKKASLSTVELVKSPGVAMVLYVQIHIMLLAFAYTAIVTLFWFTPVELGGFGFAPYQISLMMALNGAAQAAWLLLAFPPLQHRFGTNGVLRGCAFAYPFFFLFFPIGNQLLRSGAYTVFWIMVPVVTTIGVGVSMSFTAIQLAVNDVSPSPQVLGTINALALMASSLTRAFAPALFSSLFALGAKTQWLWGYAIWLLLGLMGIWFAVISRWLPETTKEKQQPKRHEQEREVLIRSQDQEQEQE